MTKLKFGTKEWSDESRNIQLGCKNNCIYCYARANAARFKQIPPGEWHKAKPSDTWKSIPDSEHKKIFMFPTTHDIFPSNVDKYIERCEEIMKKGHRVLMTTKARFYCVKKVCNHFLRTGEDFKSLFEIRISVSSSNEEILKLWEPNASNYSERIDSLKYAFFHGFKTSISMEPFLDQTFHDIISNNKKYTTEGIWLGKLHKGSSRIKLNDEYQDNIITALNTVNTLQSDQMIEKIYKKYCHDKKVHFKESIMKVINRNYDDKFIKPHDIKEKVK